MTPKQENYRNTARTIIRHLQKRQMEGYYCESSSEAVQQVLSLIPAGSSIGWGGSQTLIQSGLLNAVKNGDYTIFDRDSTSDPVEKRQIYSQIFNADFFLMSSNAITLDGELINIDGNGNRVASLCFGPKQVIVVAGMNKVVSDVDCGLKRVRDIAAPANNVRLGSKTPCATTGRCADCLVADCICSQMVVTRFSGTPGRIKVILVGESLGF